jgi:hypothetical protein
LFHDFGNFAWLIPGCTLPLKSGETPACKKRCRKEGCSPDVAADADKTLMTEAQSHSRHYEEMQSAPRFPIHLSASVKMQGSAYNAETENISANGVLFAMDNDVPVGSMVDFTILLPAEVVGARRDVQIDCRGRVVRSFEDRGRRGVGVVIDEYHFERA